MSCKPHRIHFQSRLAMIWLQDASISGEGKYAPRVQENRNDESKQLSNCSVQHAGVVWCCLHFLWRSYTLSSPCHHHWVHRRSRVLFLQSTWQFLRRFYRQVKKKLQAEITPNHLLPGCCNGMSKFLPQPSWRGLRWWFSLNKAGYQTRGAKRGYTFWGGRLMSNWIYRFAQWDGSLILLGSTAYSKNKKKR